MFPSCSLGNLCLGTDLLTNELQSNTFKKKRKSFRENKEKLTCCTNQKIFKQTQNPGKMESMLTSNKRLEDFIYLNKIKTEILNPDWLKKGEYLSLNVYLFSLYPFSLTPLVGTSHRPDIIIKYISLSLLRSCLVLRYTLDFSIGARALSTESQIEE